MLHARIARVAEDDVERLRGWLASLSPRRSELLESHRQQGTFLRSSLPIDVECKTLAQEISPEDANVELLYESAQLVDVAAA